MTKDGWIGIDLDGTLAHYDGWHGIAHIGEPIAPMVERIRRHMEDGVECRIFTARASGLLADLAIFEIEKWCLKHVGVVLAVTNKKDFAMIRLYDDRAIQIEFNTGRRIDGLDD